MPIPDSWYFPLTKEEVRGGKWHNTPAGPIFVPKGWKLWISKPWIRNFKGPDPRKFETSVVRVSLRDPRKIKLRFRNGRRGKPVRVNLYIAFFSRYRERDLDAGTYLIGRSDRLITHNTVMGRAYNLVNGKTVQLPFKIKGGDLLPSLNIEKTWDNINSGPPYRGGGPFRNLVCHLPSSGKVGNGTFSNLGAPATTPDNYGVYEGAFADDGEWRAGPTYQSIRDRSFSTFSNLSTYHTRAWDMTKPKIPKGNLGQFLYELRDLPKMLETTASAFHLRWGDLSSIRRNSARIGHELDGHGFFLPYMRPKDVADHFVNHEFGLRPFLDDINKLISVWEDQAKHIQDLIRDNGIFVRKRRVLDESETIESFTWLPQSATIPSSSSLVDANGRPMCQILPSPVGNGTGLTVFTQRTRKKVWAVGAFKYYRPEFDMRLFYPQGYNQLLTLRRLMTLYGVRITPTLVYKLTPWTWLIDWFTGFGSYIQRLDDFVVDGIVSKYLYVMNHEETEVTKSCTLNFYSGPITVNFQRRFSLKQREVADTPYGFGVPWKNLTPRQWGVLGALGFLRTPNGFISRGA